MCLTHTVAFGLRVQNGSPDDSAGGLGRNTRSGGLGVMFKRATASRHTAISEDQPVPGPVDAAAYQPRDGMTRAQARALSRCAPLTPGEFEARRRVAERGLVSLRGVQDNGPGGPASRG